MLGEVGFPRSMACFARDAQFDNIRIADPFPWDPFKAWAYAVALVASIAPPIPVRFSFVQRVRRL